MTAAGLAAFHGAQRIVPQAVVPFGATDLWFDSDSPRVYMNMTSFGVGKPSYTKRHPLFIPAMLPLVRGLRAVTGLEMLQAVRVVTSAVAAVWLGLLFALLRSLGCRRLDAVLLSLLASVSAASLFWMVIQETWALGSIAIMLALHLVLIAQQQPVREGWYTAATAWAMGTTITNWMVGIIMTLVQLPWRRALQVNANALCVVVLLWTAQHYIHPADQFFLYQRTPSKYIFHPDAGGPKKITAAFIYHAMVMPQLQEVKRPAFPGNGLSVQHSPPGSAGGWGHVAAGLWTILLALGVWAMTRGALSRDLRLVVSCAVLGQWVLHLIYGQEVFLYVLHWLPLLIVVVACGTLTTMRPVVLACASLLLLTAGVNNVQQFRQAVA